MTIDSPLLWIGAKRGARLATGPPSSLSEMAPLSPDNRRADALRYPIFKRMMEEQFAARDLRMPFRGGEIVG